MKNIKHIGLWLTVFTPLVILMGFVAPFGQDQTYHRFADAFPHLGVDNFNNVITNIPFCIFGFIGIRDYFRNRETYSISWLIFFIGVFLVGPGSAYYHYQPNNFTLVWDRLPMTIGFMGLACAIFCELYKVKNEVPYLLLLIAVGFSTVIYWYQVDDLRPYYWVQLAPIVSVVFISIFMPTKTLKPKYLIGAVLFYVAAKLTERNDRFFLELVNYSGHAIKHLLASVCVYILIKMKRAA